jgi:thiol-disulfide isomerase/thioredoxin
MDSRARLAGIIAAGLAVVTIAVAVLYGTNGQDVHATPPAIWDKFQLTEGQPQVPDVEFEDAAGNRKTLADFKGRVVLLNLWATWCGPCVMELPDLARAQTELPQDKVLVLPIDMEKLPAEKVAAFLKEHNAGALPVYVDRQLSLMREFEAFALPLTILIDADGREIGRAAGPQPWHHEDSIAYLRALGEKPRS